MSYSRSVKPQIFEILAIETLYLLAVVLTENNWRIPLQVCTCYESLQENNTDNYLFYLGINNVNK